MIETARIRHVVAGSPANSAARTTLVRSAGSNAGVKRNRLPTGTKAVRTPTYLAQDTAAAYERAARASGDMSFSLYLEQLRKQFEAERGALPIFGTAVIDHQEAAEPAA